MMDATLTYSASVPAKNLMPFGFIEVSSVLQQIARTRGFVHPRFPAPFSTS
jgi:hypothetical protein